MKVLALIPARSGSKGVVKKNIKLLAEFPLIAYTIGAAKLSTKIDKIIVSTDTEEIAKIALSFGAEVPFLRPPEISGDTSTDEEFVLHSLEWLKKNENYIPDLIVLLRVTTPLREIEHIDKAIQRLLKHENITSLRSAHLVAESPFKWFCVENELYTSICEKYTLEDTNKPRQSFKEVYIPNGYVDVLKTNIVQNMQSLYGDKILSYITPNGYEIDTIEEFEYIEYLLSKKDTTLLKYLQEEKH